MKLTNVLMGAITLASIAVGIDVKGGSEKNAVLDFEINYSIDQHPQSTETDVVELFNGDSITLTYTGANTGDKQLAIIGVGGSFRDPKTGAINTNITTGSVGPVILEQGQSQQFKQSINLNLIPDNYILSPAVYVASGEEIITVEPRQQLANVSDVAISIFSPQLLFLELVLLATFAAIGYIGYDLFGKKYFNSISQKKVSSVKPPVKASSPVDGKSFDSSWIPEGHIKRKSKKTD